MVPRSSQETITVGTIARYLVALLIALLDSLELPASTVFIETHDAVFGAFATDLCDTIVLFFFVCEWSFDVEGSLIFERSGFAVALQIQGSCVATEGGSYWLEGLLCIVKSLECREGSGIFLSYDRIFLALRESDTIVFFCIAISSLEYRQISLLDEVAIGVA